MMNCSTRVRRAVLTAAAVVMAAAQLAACSTPAPAIKRHDFGVPPAAPGDAARAPGATPEVTVSAPIWLDTPSVLYRLDYADDSQLHAYAQTQWVAAPSRLLEQALLASGPTDDPRVCSAAGGAPVRLDVNLQEFSQAFDKPGDSHVVLRAKVRVLSTHTHAVLAQRQFDLRAAAPTPDGPGAVHGLRDLAQTFAASALAWAASCPADNSSASQR